jgi:hypothetical protein
MEIEVSRPWLPTFFTTLLLALALIAWFSGSKAQAQMSGDDERLQSIIQSHIVDDGLWMCMAPLNAHNLDGSLETALKTGITLTRPVLNQVVNSTYNDVCKRVDADNLKPIGYLAGWDTVRVAGKPHGKGMQTIVGWTPMSMYLAYMQRHVVRKLGASEE